MSVSVYADVQETSTPVRVLEGVAQAGKPASAGAPSGTSRFLPTRFLQVLGFPQEAAFRSQRRQHTNPAVLR